jgi:hypothetical protein
MVRARPTVVELAAATGEGCEVGRGKEDGALDVLAILERRRDLIAQWKSSAATTRPGARSR